MIKLINLLELGINPINITPEIIGKYYSKYIFNQSGYAIGYEGWHEYIKICKPYCQKYRLYSFIGKNDFDRLSQQDLNKIYREMKALVQKYSQINELGINKPYQVWDVTEENWPNLSSAIFDKIKVGDKIKDEYFIGTVYEREDDDFIGMCISYQDDNDENNQKFLTRDWFDEVNQ